MDYLDKIPPAIRIVLDENIETREKPQNLIGKLKRLFPELRKQAEWTKSSFRYFDEERKDLSGSFVVTSSAGIDPFSRYGLCSEKQCRIEAANQFSRTVGLYADVVTISDPLTKPLFSKNFLPTKRNFQQLLDDIVVLKSMEPLIRAGVVRFRTYRSHTCEHCLPGSMEPVHKVLSQLLEAIAPELKFQRRNDFIEIDTGNLFTPTLFKDERLSPELKSQIRNGLSIDEAGRIIYQENLKRILRDVVENMISSANIKASLFSSSRLHMLAVQALDAEDPKLKNIEAWESARAIDLPWIRNLSPEGIVRLRDGTGYALPRFRERMLKILSQTQNKPEDITTKIMELREEAAELTAKLDALNPKYGQLYRSVAGSLGLTISVCGFASGGIPTSMALTFLMTLLAGIHLHARKDQQEVQELVSRPAYVLLKAKEIIGHHH